MHRQAYFSCYSSKQFWRILQIAVTLKILKHSSKIAADELLYKRLNTR